MPLLWPMQKCQTRFLRGMGIGKVKIPRMALWRTVWRVDLWCQKNIGLYLTLSDTAFFVALCVLLANHCGGTTPLKSYVGEGDMYVCIRVCDLGMM